MEVRWICDGCGSKVTADEVGDVGKEPVPSGGWRQVVKCKRCLDEKEKS